MAAKGPPADLARADMSRLRSGLQSILTGLTTLNDLQVIRDDEVRHITARLDMLICERYPNIASTEDGNDA